MHESKARPKSLVVVRAMFEGVVERDVPEHLHSVSLNPRYDPWRKTALEHL